MGLLLARKLLIDWRSYRTRAPNALALLYIINSKSVISFKNNTFQRSKKLFDNNIFLYRIHALSILINDVGENHRMIIYLYFVFQEPKN